MAAPSVQNPTAVAEAKLKKKKTSKPQRTESPAPAQAVSEKANSVAPADGEDAGDSAYLRELQKNIRNINKKITHASKTDSLIAEHKEKSLDELVNLKIINADQKAQVLKKPALLAQLAQLEEQYTQVKKLDQDYRARLQADKAELTQALTDKFEKEKTDAVREAADKAAAEAQTALHDGLLTLSQFLRLAAVRRADDQNSQKDENRALEGVLMHIYSGDEDGVATMLKLVHGVNEATLSVTNEVLETTYADVKAISAAHMVPLFQSASATAADDVETDPTVAHASLTEIEAGTDAAVADTVILTNGHLEVEAVNAADGSGHIANADVGDDAANAAAESQWDTAVTGSKELSMSQEWIEVPRDPAETETGLTATPAAAANTQSWADEQPDHPPPQLHTNGHAAASAPVPAPAAAAAADDGFHQVQRHSRGRSERENGNGNGWRGGRGGGFRGRGRGGDGRGRGGRGGRGGSNGGPGGPGGNFVHRGPRRHEESA